MSDSCASVCLLVSFLELQLTIYNFGSGCLTFTVYHTDCGGCWAFGVTSALGDRISIMRKNGYPQVNLAPQVLINCHGGGTCDGKLCIC